MRYGGRKRLKQVCASGPELKKAYTSKSMRQRDEEGHAADATTGEGVDTGGLSRKLLGSSRTSESMGFNAGLRHDL